jgi:hypothetical protein
MKLIDSNLACPACQVALQPKLLVCPACDIKVEGPFQLNEFATLGSDDLHFLRIFVRSEGRIRDMESALGLSYPTIRTRLAALKRKLSGEAEAEGPGGQGPGGQGPRAEASSADQPRAEGARGNTHRDEGSRPRSGPHSGPHSRLQEEEDAVAAILARLNAGEIPFDEAMRSIKNIRTRSRTE